MAGALKPRALSTTVTAVVRSGLGAPAGARALRARYAYYWRFS
ncbi:hypothetical protein [Thermoleophilum album]|nr:hypothetical protein [Thermoleophilum album]